MATLRPSIDVAGPTRGPQVPEELLAIVLDYLCLRLESEYFSPLRGQCSLTCRHWAAHIRPAIFKRIILTSREMACTLPALVHSSVDVPAPLRETVRQLDIEMDNRSRPWLFYVWALLRDGVLPNIEQINLSIKGVYDMWGPYAARKKSEVFLDIGLPRTLPSAHPIRLKTLRLENLRFYSHASLLRSFGLHSPSTINCEDIQWSNENPVVGPGGRVPLRANLHRLETVTVDECKAVWPFILSLLTTHPPSPRTTQRLLHIHETQIFAVISMFRLFSDECECGGCESISQILMAGYLGLTRLPLSRIIRSRLVETRGRKKSLSIVTPLSAECTLLSPLYEVRT